MPLGFACRNTTRCSRGLLSSNRRQAGFYALPEAASPEVTRMAAYELAAYFEDEAPTGARSSERAALRRKASAGRLVGGSRW